MLDIVDKNCRTALSLQVSEKLIAGIRSGAMKPGRRIPGIRMLAKKFGTSNSTVIEALNLMEQQNYLERIPAKGTFIADDVSHELKLSRLIFPFPESSITPEAGRLENWGAVSEFYRGMLADAPKLNVEILFHHFEEAKTEVQLSRQIRRMDDFDGAIFIGRQLCDLRNSFVAKNKPCALLGSSTKIDFLANLANISCDQDDAFSNMASLLLERGYKGLRIISEASYHENQINEEGRNLKMDSVVHAMNAKGIIVETSMIHELKTNDDAGIDEVFGKFILDMKKRREAIFPFNAYVIPAIYRYAARNKLQIGKDLAVFGYASGITFNNLIPELTYSKINFFEMGRAACRIVVAAIQGNEWRGAVIKIPNTLIINDSI